MRLAFDAFALLALVALVLWGGIEAHAHGPAAWIMENVETSWCCGPEDCESVDGRIALTDLGYAVRGVDGAIMPSAKGFYYRPTPDGHPWACRDLSDNTLRCVILPEGQL